MKKIFFFLMIVAGLAGNSSAEDAIQAFCVDFNWGPGGSNAFAGPGVWADADPEAHVAWYAGLGVNTIQTFCVSCNGYAWYKGGIVPEQPGLKHDFLPEMVRRGHQRGMKVMGYFCVAANTRWSLLHPDQSYGAKADFNLVMTDEYLDFLTASIQDALEKTGIDGFMIDWLWNPDRARKSQNKGVWIDAEKKLYQQVMGKLFPGEEKLTPEMKTAYDRKNIGRVWARIRDAAKAARPDCIIWLSCYDITHPSVAGSKLFAEVDWLMNEAPGPEKFKGLSERSRHGQRLIQCLVGWGDKHDALAVLTRKGGPTRDFYGFARPGDNSLPLPISRYLESPVDSFSGNDRNIAVLARFFNGKLEADK